MVYKIEAELALLLASQGMMELFPEGFPSSMKGLGEQSQRELVSKIVKNFLITPSQELAKQTPQITKLLHLVRLLPSLKEELPKDVVKWIEKMEKGAETKTEGQPVTKPEIKEPNKLDPALKPKTESKPTVRIEPKAEIPLKEKILDKGPTPLPLAHTLEVVIKEVIKALYILIPQPDRKETDPLLAKNEPVPIQAPKGNSETEFTNKNPDPVVLREDKKNESKKEIHPSLNTLKPGKPLENRTFQPQAPTQKPEAPMNQTPIHPTAKLPMDFELPKKQPTVDASVAAAASAAPKLAPGQMPPSASPTIITAAPYASQAQQNDIRRKEKKKRPRNPWEPEGEDEEDDLERRYPFNPKD